MFDNEMLEVQSTREMLFLRLKCVCVCVCVCVQGRGKVFYVGGAVGGGGGGGSQFLHINITPNRNRKSCYSLRTFMRSC